MCEFTMLRPGMDGPPHAVVPDKGGMESLNNPFGVILVSFN